MVARNSMANPKRIPAKEDIEEYLGVSRFRRFDLIYKELIELGLVPKMEWHVQDQLWYLAFQRSKKSLFSIYWGIDFFYAHLILSTDDYKLVARDKAITPDALTVLQKNPPNQTQQNVRIEANLENMRALEGFLELLPVMIRLLT